MATCATCGEYFHDNPMSEALVQMMNEFFTHRFDVREVCPECIMAELAVRRETSQEGDIDYDGCLRVCDAFLQVFGDLGNPEDA